ncbi:MAG TPA: ATP-binding protein [Blastocatellia bacterium]|nr:ATP-binding protein [Blastocatellia bacterium]
MSPLRLHTKTTLLVSAITLAMLLAVLFVVSARMVDLVIEGEKELARLQALSLAEQISLMSTPRDQDDIDRAISQARLSRPNMIAVRVWEQAGEGLIERAGSTDGSPAEEIPEEVKAMARAAAGSGKIARLRDYTLQKQTGIHYRVFAPITERGKLYGVVEVTERPDNIPSIVTRYAQTALLLALVAIVLTTIAVYALFRRLAYRPMSELLDAMSRAEAGSLDIAVPARAQDEFGRLATGFNRMIERIRELTRERELRSQRLESLGALAGGIAHDLNNILSPLSISTFLLRSKVSDPHAQETLDTMEEVIERGGQLVKQVLSFARGMEGDRVRVDPKPALREVIGMLKETFPKSIKIKYAVAESAGAALVDRTQLSQVLMNLCVNARDAMPQGGDLEITVESARLDEHYAQLAPDAKPGRYVVISVKDTGVGIPPKVIDKIFDPFFTTKEQGKGTGLGLSTSLGIVRSHGGFIKVYSEPGAGALFKVYLPALDDGAAATEREEQPEPPAGNGELILVIDDEEPLRRVTRGMLEAFGYRVVTASDGAEACAIYRQKRHEISAVLTDMMMPVMDGAAVIAELRRLNPLLPIIASSGLAEAGKEEQARSLGAQKFLSKPYTPASLLWALRESLRGGPNGIDNGGK